MKFLINLARTNLALKCFSLLFGFMFWLIIGSTHSDSMEVEIPICFYNDNAKKVEAPETMHVTLSGKRFDLYHLDINKLALHVDLTSYESGRYALEPSAEKLFLPSSIKLVHWNPSNIVVSIS